MRIGGKVQCFLCICNKKCDFAITICPIDVINNKVFFIFVFFYFKTNLSVAKHKIDIKEI